MSPRFGPILLAAVGISLILIAIAVAIVPFLTRVPDPTAALASVLLFMGWRLVILAAYFEKSGGSGIGPLFTFHFGRASALSDADEPGDKALEQGDDEADDDPDSDTPARRFVRPGRRSRGSSARA